MNAEMLIHFSANCNVWILFYTSVSFNLWNSNMLMVFENTVFKNKNLIGLSFLLHFCIYGIYPHITKFLATPYFKPLRFPQCYCDCAVNKLLKSLMINEGTTRCKIQKSAYFWPHVFVYIFSMIIKLNSNCLLSFVKYESKCMYNLDTFWA